MFTTRARSAAALLAASALLVACGGDDDTSDAPITEPPAAASTATTVAATGPATPASTTATGSTTDVATSVAAGGDSTTPDTTADTTADTAPPTSPAEPTESIEDLIAASQTESPVVVYGNPNDQMWEAMKAGLAELYPWIELQTFDLGGVEAFQRYLSETATGVASADLIIASEAAGWLDLVERGGVVPYVDPQLTELPEFAHLAPGVYTMSVDPLIAIFNQHIVPADEQPTTLAGLADLAPTLPGAVGTIEIENSQAYMANYGFVTAHGDAAWAALEALAPYTTAESSTGALLGKALSGEYPAAYFVAGTLRALIDNPDEAAGDVLDYRYLEDITPIVPRGMGVTAGGDSPASAKLFVNFMLSAAGAEAACASGLSPYRDDAECAFGYQAIIDAVGADNVVLVPYDVDLEAQRESVQARWNETFGR
jgi:iron(III) transport system substrate-binding protein